MTANTSSSQDQDKKQGFSFSTILNQGKLAWKLFRDPNVSPWLKFGLPIIGLIYLISPIDILPDVIPVLGQMDDVAVLMLLTQLFITLAPDNIVNMYRQASQAAGFNPDAASDPSPQPAEADVPPPDDEDVIDTEYRVVS
jgi:uncharacterized membrane protein YkvA (DUF1232 family)